MAHTIKNSHVYIKPYAGYLRAKERPALYVNTGVVNVVPAATTHNAQGSQKGKRECNSCLEDAHNIWLLYCFWTVISRAGQKRVGLLYTCCCQRPGHLHNLPGKAGFLLGALPGVTEAGSIQCML